MKTEDIVTYAVLGVAIYMVLDKAFGKPAPKDMRPPAASPIPIPGGVNPATLNTSIDFGLNDPTGNWD